MRKSFVWNVLIILNIFITYEANHCHTIVAGFAGNRDIRNTAFSGEARERFDRSETECRFNEVETRRKRCQKGREKRRRIWETSEERRLFSAGIIQRSPHRKGLVFWNSRGSIIAFVPCCDAFCVGSWRFSSAEWWGSEQQYALFWTLWWQDIVGAFVGTYSESWCKR